MSPFPTPAAAAIASIDVASRPRVASSRPAASRIWLRLRAASARSGWSAAASGNSPGLGGERRLAVRGRELG